MDIKDRLSKALRKRWEKYGSDPEKFHLNLIHWNQLYWAWEQTSATSIANAFLSPESFMYMGTLLILRNKWDKTK